ncbi:MAG: DUF5320 domain-containing protein [Tepidanaerobacteraceae bacterium]|nr:DUF5320 domain-containing protein [Tepidanaerobacteraceae bacterium]
MPRGDGSGPAGYGPMTGRGAGYCAGFSVPGYANPIPGNYGGRGRGFGFYGRGRGYRHQFYATGLPFWARNTNPFESAPGYYGYASPDNEEKSLSQEAEFLKQELKAIENRLDQLQKTKEEDLGD